MKKLVLLTLSLLSLLAISCKMTIKDQDLFERPEITSSATGFTIIISKYSSDTKYINVYRKDVTSSSDSEAVVENIGIVLPSSYNSDDKTYLYHDDLVTEKRKYKYMLRYCESDKYYFTEWTDAFTVAAGIAYPEGTKLSYDTQSVQFTYKESEKQLTCTTAPSDPQITNYATEWSPALAVSNGAKTQVFKISNPLTTIDLKTILPDEFKDTEIKIIGLVAQKTIAEGTGASAKIKQIVWSVPSSMKIQGHTANTLKVESDPGSDGYDFS